MHCKVQLGDPLIYTIDTILSNSVNYLLNLIKNDCKKKKNKQCSKYCRLILFIFYSIVYRTFHNQDSAKIEECLAKEPYLGWWQQTKAHNGSLRINALSTSISREIERERTE